MPGVAEEHIWRTVDGRYVPHLHPEAAFLAYAKGHQVPAEVLETLGLNAVAEHTAPEALEPAPKRPRGRPRKDGTNGSR